MMVVMLALLAFGAPAYAEGNRVELSASQLQKELTTESGQDVEGIADANNEMTVAKSSLTTRKADENGNNSSNECQDSCELN